MIDANLKSGLSNHGSKIPTTLAQTFTDFLFCAPKRSVAYSHGTLENSCGEFTVIASKEFLESFIHLDDFVYHHVHECHFLLFLIRLNALRESRRHARMCSFAAVAKAVGPTLCPMLSILVWLSFAFILSAAVGLN